MNSMSTQPQFTLRPYQVEASDRSVAFLKSKSDKHGLLVLPTGSGKSLIIADTVQRLDGPTLVFQPSREILKQNFAKLMHYGFRPAVYSASLGKKQISMEVTMATIGSVAKNAADFDHVKYVLVDECDLINAKAGMYCDFFKALESRKVRILGLTATPYRLTSTMEGPVLKFLTRTRPRVFSELVYYVQNGQLFRDGHLAKLDYFPIKGFDRSKLQANSTGADYTDRSVQLHFKEMYFANMLQRIVERLLAIGRKGILVFTRFIEESQALVNAIPGAAMVSAETPSDERDRILKEFKAGNIRVVCNVGVLSVGFDYPELDTVVLARPTMSLRLYYQQCLDDQTEILTQRGWMKHAQMCESDNVAAMDQKTGLTYWRPVQRITRRRILPGERMFGIKSPHLDIRVTDQHDMIVRSVDRRLTRWQKESALEVSERNGLFKIPVSSLQSSAGADLSDDELRVIGWFLTDGNLNKKTNALTISQSASKPTHCEAIRSALRGAGLKFGECVNKRSGKWAVFADNIMFTVSNGRPRGRDKDLRGWAHLAPWLDKSFPPVFELLTSAQLSILLGAMNLGDGKNTHNTITWTPRTITLACGDNEVLTDRLQSLCVRRGLRCNKATYLPSGNKRRVVVSTKTQWVLHIKPVTESTIAGRNVMDGSVSGGKQYKRSRFVEVPVVDGESVWCVTNDLGTLFVRRNGKVAIVGNCGRVVRTHPNKVSAMVVDMVGLMEQFGKVEDLRIDRTKKDLWYVESRGKQLTNVVFGTPRF